MRSIAASILILAASILFVGATFTTNNASSFVLSVIGCIVGGIGLIDWFFSAAEADKKKSDSAS